jgi:hypothetical protein
MISARPVIASQSSFWPRRSWPLNRLRVSDSQVIKAAMVDRSHQAHQPTQRVSRTFEDSLQHDQSHFGVAWGTEGRWCSLSRSPVFSPADIQFPDEHQVLRMSTMTKTGPALRRTSCK